MNRFHRSYCSSDLWAKTVRETLVPWVLNDVDLGDEALEVGPGPGLTTFEIRERVARLTTLEVDAAAAAVLERNLDGSNVTVVQGDGTQMPFQDGAFTGAICCTMLHHIPSPQLQDRLLGTSCPFIHLCLSRRGTARTPRPPGDRAGASPRQD